MGDCPPGRSPLGAELAGGVQVLRRPVVGVGGDAVAVPVGVVELDVDAPGPGSVQGGDAPAGRQGAARLHGCPRPFRDGQDGQGPGCLGRQGPAPCRVRRRVSAPGPENREKWCAVGQVA